MVNNYNLYLFLCYDSIQLNSLLNNYGNWIIIGGVVLIIGFVFVFFIYQIKSINNLLNKFVPPPPKNSNDEPYIYSTNSKVVTNELYKIAENHQLMEEVKEKKDELLLEELNELSYEEAIIEDKRAFFIFYLSLVSDKQMIFDTINKSSPFYPLTLRLVMLVFTIMTFFFLNAFFFTEDYISQRFNSDADFDILYIMNNEFEKSVYASVVCLFISKIMLLITNFDSRFYQILRKSNKELSNCEEKIYSLIFSYKFIVKIFLIIISILICLYWYFLLIFCSVYKTIQFGWIESSLISISFNLIFPILWCLFMGIIKFCGIKFKNKMFFIIGNFFINIL